jgi:hypothetical protein
VIRIAVTVEENTPTVLGEIERNGNSELQRMKGPVEVLCDEVNRGAMTTALQYQDAKCVDDQGRCEGRVVSRCCEVGGKIK